MWILAMTDYQRGEAFGTGLCLFIFSAVVVFYFVRNALIARGIRQRTNEPTEEEIAKELSSPGPPRFNG